MPRQTPASTESQCDSVIAQIYGESCIVKFGRKDRRTPNTAGIPDRLYFAGSRLVWFEVKSPSDFLSEKQIAFLTKVLAAHGVAGCGGKDELLTLLNAPSPAKVGHEQIGRYSSWSEYYKRRKGT